MSTYRRLILLLSLGLTLTITCMGCAPRTTEDTATSIAPLPEYPGAVYEAGDMAYPSGYYIHTVKLPDESISIIAKWFTGDLMNWEILAQCNPTIDPNRIFLGDRIRIPRSIMVRQDPITPEFVAGSQPRAKPVPAEKALTPEPEPEVEPEPEPETKPIEEEEPILFGPKGYSLE